MTALSGAMADIKTFGVRLKAKHAGLLFESSQTKVGDIVAVCMVCWMDASDWSAFEYVDAVDGDYGGKCSVCRRTVRDLAQEF